MDAAIYSFFILLIVSLILHSHIFLYIPIFLQLYSALLEQIVSEDCFKGGEHRICLPTDYSKYDPPPSSSGTVLVSIEVHIKDIPKVL